MKMFALVAAVFLLSGAGFAPALAQTPPNRPITPPPGPPETQRPGGSWEKSCPLGYFESKGSYIWTAQCSVNGRPQDMKWSRIDPNGCRERMLKNLDGKLACEL
jgi:hypothetical protein